MMIKHQEVKKVNLNRIILRKIKIIVGLQMIIPAKKTKRTINLTKIIVMKIKIIKLREKKKIKFINAGAKKNTINIYNFAISINPPC